jgi:hypothetical protein
MAKCWREEQAGAVLVAGAGGATALARWAFGGARVAVSGVIRVTLVDLRIQAGDSGGIAMGSGMSDRRILAGKPAAGQQTKS